VQLRRRRRWPWVAALPVAVAVVVVATREEAPQAPPLPAGAVALGSRLGPGAVETRDCEGRPPGPNSLACTFSAAVAAPADGVVRGWAVRGARGELAMQVVRRRSDGTYTEVGRSQYEVVPDEEPHRFAAEVPVRRGDLLGVELQPGAGVGVRRSGDALLRWMGPLELIRAPREADPASVSGRGELLARFDLVRGAQPRRPPQLRGAAAQAAPGGRVLSTEDVEFARGRVVVVSVVETPEGIAVDLAHDGRRVARVSVPDVDPAGRLVILEQGFTASDYVRLQWRDPGRGPLIVHGYAVSAGRLDVVH
jgi:hypothetical protein